MILSDPGLAAAFETAQTYMELTINTGPITGLPVTLSPRQQITSVPYALNAGGSARPVLIDFATKTDSQSFTEPDGEVAVLATGGGGPLQAQLTLPSASYVVTVMAKVMVKVDNESGDTTVSARLKENCGAQDALVDAAKFKEKDSDSSWDTVPLVFVNTAPVAGTCTYSLWVETNDNDATVNDNSFGTSILARADPI